jgi:hypothetical protein
MTGLDLRPLSLGEILDRTFSLYRRNFLLFMGIAGIPAIAQLSLALSPFVLRINPFVLNAKTTQQNLAAFFVLGGLGILVALVAYLFSQGATIFAVTDLYLGRTTGIGQSLRRVWGSLLSLFGVVFLNGLVILLCTLALVIPGIYMMCRLLVCVPAALVEDRGPRESLSRSFELTRDSAGRAFVIFVLYFILAFAIGALLNWPFTFLAILTAKENPQTAQMWSAVAQVASTIGGVLINPILLIATSVFYFDLRVRKEAFDLQFMLDPASERVTRSESGNLSILP